MIGSRPAGATAGGRHRREGAAVLPMVMPVPVMRVIEAPIEKRHRETLRQTSRDSTSGLPPQLVRASRAPDTADRALWRGISVWRNREAR